MVSIFLYVAIMSIILRPCLLLVIYVVPVTGHVVLLQAIAIAILIVVALRCSILHCLFSFSWEIVDGFFFCMKFTVVESYE